MKVFLAKVLRQIRQSLKPLQIIPPIGPILILAIALRIGYMPGFGHEDLSILTRWTQTIQQVGVLNFYAQPDVDRFYPPLAVSLMAATAHLPSAAWPGEPPFLVLLKLFPVLFDLALIALCYFYLRREPPLNWLIPLILTLAHGLTLVSAWWGQTDSQFTLLVVLTLIALSRDRPVSAWVFFSLAVLMKQQSAVIGPLLLILTFRRYGLLSVVKGGLAAALVAVLVIAPFAAGSGLQNALKPYLGALNSFPVATVNALNWWYVATPHQKLVMPFPFDAVPDSQPLIGALTYRQVGLLLLGTYLVVLCVSIWQRAKERREFVWATALYLGTFMLATQMHERYLYPAVVLAVISIAQDRSMWPIAVGLIYTFTYNVTQIVPTRVRFLWPESLALHVAWLNVIILIEVTRHALLAGREQAVLKGALVVCRIGAALIIASLIITLISDTAANYPAAQWLAEHLADDAQLVTERQEVMKLTRDWEHTWHWRWQMASKIEEKPVSMWAQEGVQYLLVDGRTALPDEGFEQRLTKLSEQGAVIVYQSAAHAVLRVIPTPK